MGVGPHETGSNSRQDDHRRAAESDEIFARPVGRDDQNRGVEHIVPALVKERVTGKKILSRAHPGRDGDK